jgi:hypothetical protein
MTGDPEANEAPQPSSGERPQGQYGLDLEALEREALMAWVGDNLTLVRRTASGQRIPYWIFATAFAVGLAAHVGGFLLKGSVTTEPWALLADLFYALGWAMWTGVVLVAFIEIWPEIKKRQYQQVLDTYEAAMARKARMGGANAPDQAGAQDA